MLIPDAPSASAATNPRLSAIPPEARNGIFTSCAARTSCLFSDREIRQNHHRTTYQYQCRNVFLARMPSTCLNSTQEKALGMRVIFLPTFKPVNAKDIYPEFLRRLEWST